MKKFILSVLVMVFFSFIAENLIGIRHVYAETTKTELINENDLKLDYDYEVEADATLWRISFKRQSVDEKFDQRLKLKVTDEKDKTIDYPVVHNMQQKDEWLVEENFSQAMEGQVVLKLPKSVDKLRLYVQLDQKKVEDSEIQEDILANKKPFELTVKPKKEESSKQTSETAKKTVKKKDKTVSISSEEFVGPKTQSQLAQTQNQSVTTQGTTRATTAQKYVNKEPQYTSNASEGTYPTASWQPTGQTNVINHQGGVDNVASNVWDGLQSWNVSPDNYENSYIHYGVGQVREDIALRKYATKTDKEDEFNIRLNVRGDSITKPGIDIFFVLDNSASMEFTKTENKIDGKLRKDVAVESLKKIINQFETGTSGLPEGPDYIRIGGTIFGDQVIATHDLSSSSADWEALVTAYEKTPTGSHNTYTQGGLIEAQKKLQSDPSRRKVVFLLTDGAPNRSRKILKGKVDQDIFYDGIRITEYDQSEAGHTLTATHNTTYLRSVSGTVDKPTYTEEPMNIANEAGGTVKVQSHLDMANSQAADLRDGGIEIQTIAIGIYPGDYEKHTKDELLEGLYRMATKKAGAVGNEASDYYFYHAEKQSDFDKSFNEWYDSVLSTVEDGVIEDPLGDMVELVGTPTVKDVSLVNGKGEKEIRVDKMAKVDTSNPRKVRITDINLYAKQEIEVNYTVRLKTNDPNFSPGKWYPANGRTTLTPTPNRSADVLDFGVPSVRLKKEDFVIPIEKEWEDSQNEWGHRKTSITVVLERKKGNTFEKVEEKALGVGNGWKTSFAPVEGGSAIYRIREIVRVPGYAPPTYSYSQGEFTQASLGGATVKLTNKLLKGSINFHKYKEDGKTPFTDTKPQFTVKRKRDGKVLVTGLEPESSGLVTISGIPVGEYVLEETSVPTGYVEGKTWDLTATELSDGSGVQVTIDGQSSNIKIINERKKDFVIPVEKYWADYYKTEDDYWGLRQTVKVTLQIKEGTEWRDLETLSLTKDKKWKGKFQGVDGGDDKIYRVVEQTKVPGYAPPEYNVDEFTKSHLGTNDVVVINTLLKGNTSFTKVRGNSDGSTTPFTGDDLPKFTVKRKSDGKLLAENLTPDGSGKVSLANVPIGEFIIEESHVPNGYSKLRDISLKVVEENGSLSFTFDNKPTGEAINFLKPFSLMVNKVDQDNHPLKGAKFRLTGPNEYDVTIGSTSSDGATFIFDFLFPGEYELTETVTPTDYDGLKTPFKFTVSEDGKVTFSEDSNVKGKYTLDDSNNDSKLNSIHLTVMNKKKNRQGVLPFTGGITSKFFFKLASGFITVGGLLTGLYWFYSRRKEL